MRAALLALCLRSPAFVLATLAGCAGPQEPPLPSPVVEPSEVEPPPPATAFPSAPSTPRFSTEPLDGERLCTISERTSPGGDDRKIELRQFESSAGNIVRTVEREIVDGVSVDRSDRFISYAPSGDLLRLDWYLNLGAEPRVSQIWEYDAEGLLKRHVWRTYHSADEFQSYRFEGRLLGPARTTGMSEAPERFREPAPVELLLTQIPFEGRVFIGDAEIDEFDSSGRLVAVSVPDPRDPDAPWTTSRRSHDAEGRL